ncbi:MAG: hypothetical protein OEV37_02235 [Candidatus Berkelbacteria bacterium]|nr:hypothetical protein [Candidatus Berkelbacteria bacterium]
MQIQKNKDGNLEIKSKKATVVFDGKVVVNDVELEGAGEYEVGEIAIEGIDDDIYIFQIEDVVLGSVNFKSKITKENVERLANCDAVLVRLDGKVHEAVEQAGQIQPDTIIYAGTSRSATELKSSGVSFTKSDSIKLSKADIGQEKSYFLELADGNGQNL